MSAAIRKIVVQLDESHLEMGQAVEPPTRRAVAMAVIANPFAGRYAANLDELIAIGEELGTLLGARCVAAFVRSHFDAIEARIADAPRRDEIVVAIAVTDSGRPLPRVGGLKVSEIQGKDGLR